VTHRDLLGGPPPTYLPGVPAAAKALEGGTPAAEVAAAYPADSLAWAVLAEDSLAAGQPVAGYAYARTGYHRGLDSLRRNGWKGFGPVPWSHEPNRGFLRALAALGQAATAIDEPEEIERVGDLLTDCDPSAPR
jgi:hypothetical protein